MRIVVLILSALMPLLATVLLFPDATLWVADVVGLARGLPETTDLDLVLSRCQVRSSPGAQLICPTRLPKSAFAPVLRAMVERSEDWRFRFHGGVDWRATAASLPAVARHDLLALTHGRAPRSVSGLRGASTLTQQVARLLVVGSEKTLMRKLREMIVAERIESLRSKDEIETIYLNIAPLGGGAVGFDAAARRSFGRSAADLNASEAALLAGQLPAPATRNVTVADNRTAADEAARRVLQKALSAGILSAPQYRAALAGLAPAEHQALLRHEEVPTLEIRPYLDLARTELDRSIPLTGDDRLLLDLDPQVQDWAGREAEAIAGRYEAAGLFMRADGEVVAVGSSNYLAQQFGPAFRAERSIGSLGKILTLIGGHTTGKLARSFPFHARDPEAFPRDHDPACLGWVSFQVALAKSCNKAFANLAEQIGSPLVRVISRLGFSVPRDLRQVPTGGVQSNLLSVARMLATLANRGAMPRPRALAGVLGPTGTVLQEAAILAPTRVMSPEAARAVMHDLRIPVEPGFEGTGVRAYSRLVGIWGKTGTSNDNRDAWFAGGVNEGQGTVMVGGFWMGTNDDRPMAGVVGGGGPAVAFKAVAEHLTHDRSLQPPRQLTLSLWLTGLAGRALTQLTLCGFLLFRLLLLASVGLVSFRLIGWSRSGAFPTLRKAARA